MRELAVARRYARALFLISRERAVVADTSSALESVARLFECASVARLLTSPAASSGDRRAAVAAVCTELRLSKLMQNFLGLLAEKRRLGALPAISLLFEKMVDQEAGRARARIVSAVPLNDSAVREVKDMLARRIGKEVVPQVEVEPELLAGVVVYAQGRVYDGSVRRQLERLKHTMADE